MARRVEFEFNPFDLAGVDQDKYTAQSIKEIVNRSKEVVLEAIKSDLEEARSPVTGRSFKKLSDKYKVQKQKQGGSGIPDLSLSGDMIDAIRARSRGDSIVVGVEASQSDKADGHNNFSGESRLPLRQFIPNEGESFRPEIRDQIRGLIEEHGEEIKQLEELVDEGLRITLRRG